MPIAYIKKLADKHNISIEEAEKRWIKAKELALQSGFKELDDNFYGYVVGIFKKMMKENIKYKIRNALLENTTVASLSGDKLISQGAHIWIPANPPKPEQRMTLKDFLKIMLDKRRW